MAQLTDLTGPEQARCLKGVVFDCDGVMISSFDANRQYYNHFRAMFGLPPMSPAEEIYVHAHNVHASLARIIPPELLAEAEARRKDLDYRFLLPSLRLEEGLLELLRYLKERGVRLAVNTNRTDTMQLLVDHFGLRQFFRPVVTATMVSQSKPHPESLFYILNQWGLGPGDIAYLGDTVVDELSARAAGVRFWAYRSPSLGADLHVDSFPALTAWLKRSEGREKPRDCRL